MSFLICINYNSRYMFLLGQDLFLSDQCLSIRYLRNQRGNNYRKSKPSTGIFSIVEDFLWIIIRFLRFSSILMLFDFVNLDFCPKRHLNILICQLFSEKYCSILRSGKGSEMYFFALCYLFCFVSIYIPEQHSKTCFISLLAISIKYFM